MSILEHFPSGYTARGTQIDILEQVEQHWPKHEVMVISAPVGSGKSHIARTIAAWVNAEEKSAAILTHRVGLQDQYEGLFPDVPTLRGMSRYVCNEYQMTCREVKDAKDANCGNSCSYLQARGAAARATTAVYNYQSYVYSETARDLVICDEAHAAFDILAEMYTLNCWKHKDQYPEGLTTCGDLAVWLETRVRQLGRDVRDLIAQRSLGELDMVGMKALAKAKAKHQKYAKILSGLQLAPANFFIEHTVGDYRGQSMPLLRVRPTTLRGLPPILWGPRTKLILMSGTIGAEDVAKLGLQTSRVKYIYGQNPIPAANRPIDASWGLNMASKYQEANLPELARKVQEIADKHPGTKGLCHLTYEMSRKLQKLLPGDRYIWHTSTNSDAKLKQFLRSKEPKILMACGREEGLDLAGPDYGWQAILKMPWPNRGDKLIDKWYREDVSWIHWLTIRKLRQMVGRICRAPDDYGITYILDSGFGNPPKKRAGIVNQRRDLFGEDFLNSIIW